MCLPQEINNKLAKMDAMKLLRNSVCPLRQSIHHMGVLKKRGQFNTAFKTRYFVLNEDILEYYEDEPSYLFNKERGILAACGYKHHEKRIHHWYQRVSKGLDDES